MEVSRNFNYHCMFLAPKQTLFLWTFLARLCVSFWILHLFFFFFLGYLLNLDLSFSSSICVKDFLPILGEIQRILIWESGRRWERGSNWEHSWKWFTTLSGRSPSPRMREEGCSRIYSYHWSSANRFESYMISLTCRVCLVKAQESLQVQRRLWSKGLWTVSNLVQNRADQLGALGRGTTRGICQTSVLCPSSKFCVFYCHLWRKRSVISSLYIHFLLVYTFNDYFLLRNSVSGMEADTREENDTLHSLRPPQAGYRDQRARTILWCVQKVDSLLSL